VVSETAMDYDMNCMEGNHADYAVAFHGWEKLSPTSNARYIWNHYKIVKRTIISFSRINVLTTKRWFSPWLHPGFIWKYSGVGRKWNEYKKIILNLSDKVGAMREFQLVHVACRSRLVNNTILNPKVIRDKKKQRRLNEQNSQDSENQDSLKSRTFLDTLLDLQEKKNTFTDFQIRSETNLFLAAVWYQLF